MAVEDHETVNLANYGYPFWFGIVIDKLLVGFIIAFWWLLLVPLWLWAIFRTLFIYLFLAVVLFVPIVITIGIGVSLFLITLYWVPAISVALTTIAPLMAVALEIAAFVLNVAWFILIALVDLWNILIPLFVLIFIYAVHFLLTVVTLIASQLSASDLTSLFSELIEVAFFFADIFVILFNVIVSVLPAALTLTIQIAQPLLVLFFKTIVIVLPTVQFLLLKAVPILVVIIDSVAKLVRIFKSLLRSDPGAASVSSRYQAGIDAYFNAMVERASDEDWETSVIELEHIIEGQKHMPDYSDLENPYAPGKRKRSDDRGSLHERVSADGYDRRSVDAMHGRRKRIGVAGGAVVDGFHAVLDTAPDVTTHMHMVQGALDHSARTFLGYDSAWDALSDYNVRYKHPAQVLLTHAPDLHGSALGRWIRNDNPDDPANDGMSHHEWRRAGYPQVTDHPRADEINRLRGVHQTDIDRYRRGLEFKPVQTPDTGLPEGQVPLPFEMPVLLGSDCFRSKPKFILCLPRPKNRRFTAPDILIPTNLLDPDQCPGFVPPPDPADGFSAVKKMFNPIIAIRNTWTALRYILTATSQVLFALNAATVNNSLFGWFLELLTINDPIDGPLTTEELFCLVPFAWYVFYVLSWVFVLFALLPFLWFLFSIILFTLLPFIFTWRWVNRLISYYALTATRDYGRPRPARDVAAQKWARERSIIDESRGKADVYPGATTMDAVGQYQQMRSDPFSVSYVGDSTDASEDLSHLNTQEATALITARDRRDFMRVMYTNEVDELNALMQAAYDMGALSNDVATEQSARVHMSFWSRDAKRHPIMSHTASIAFFKDMITNLEVALGHRSASEIVPVAEWHYKPLRFVAGPSQ